MLDVFGGRLKEDVDVSGQAGKAVVDHGLTPDDEVSHVVSGEQKEKILNVRRKMESFHLPFRRNRTSLAFFPKTLCRSSLAASCLCSWLRLTCCLISHHSAALKLGDLRTTLFITLIGNGLDDAVRKFYQN